MGKNLHVFAVVSEDTYGERSPMPALCGCGTLALGGETIPLHKHDDVESFYILEGEIAFYLDGQSGRRAGTGVFVHIPGGAIHGFRIESVVARYLILTTPRHGEFYRAITFHYLMPSSMMP